MDIPYQNPGPDRDTVDALTTPTMLEFGAPWCPICQGAQPLIESALEQYPQVQRLMVEDGPGRRLGRSFRIKLWPTLVFLKAGQEIARIVRPLDEAEILDALSELTR
ncbi:MAG TPA: thioredoxin family protein [Rhodocyclaceae bacterium]|nr:thioredoxin family protein [Rhodocyclaceae bacterium]